MIYLCNCVLSLNCLLVFSLSPEVSVYLYCKEVTCLTSMNKHAMIWVAQNCNENI